MSYTDCPEFILILLMTSQRVHTHTRTSSEATGHGLQMFAPWWLAVLTKQTPVCANKYFMPKF